jgi:hypothetical protein
VDGFLAGWLVGGIWIGWTLPYDRFDDLMALCAVGVAGCGVYGGFRGSLTRGVGVVHGVGDDGDHVGTHLSYTTV